MYDQSQELFEIRTFCGKSTGKLKSRGEVHRDGDWHGSVHVWVFDGEEVLLQKRSSEKDVFPGKIDASCTGHIAPGETPQEAALRELSEELGIAANQSALRFLECRHVINHATSLYNREIAHVFLLEMPVGRTQLVYQKEEIEAIFFLEQDILTEMLKESGNIFCVIPGEWRKVRRILRRRKENHKNQMIFMRNK